MKSPPVFHNYRILYCLVVVIIVFFLLQNFVHTSCTLSLLLTVHKKAHPDILLFLYTATHAISAGVLPWIPNIYVMSGLRGVLGYCCGGNDIGTW